MKVIVSSYWGSLDSSNNTKIYEGPLEIRDGVHALARFAGYSPNVLFNVLRADREMVIVTYEYLLRIPGMIAGVHTSPHENHYWYSYQFVNEGTYEHDHEFGLVRMTAEAFMTLQPNYIAPEELVTDLV